MNERKSQKRKILNLLEARAEVTPLSALEFAGCLRLSERIRELKADGYKIDTDMVRLKNGKRVASYKLAEAAETRPTLERCPDCHTAYVPHGDSVCPEVLRRRRAVMPDYDKKLEDWLS